MDLMNTEQEDYHVHSFNFSDGLATIDEIVIFAGKIGLRKIIITDHSQASIDKDGAFRKSPRVLLKDKRWKNVHNDVDVSFGVEADLLNENGDACFHIQDIEGDFIILSYHPEIFEGDPKNAGPAFIKAIEKYRGKINMLGHLFLSCEGDELIKIIELANKHKIALELNCRYLFRGLSDDKSNPWRERILEGTKLILTHADRVYVTSDAHTLYELKELRKKGFEFLKKNGYIKDA